MKRFAIFALSMLTALTSVPPAMAFPTVAVPKIELQEAQPVQYRRYRGGYNRGYRGGYRGYRGYGHHHGGDDWAWALGGSRLAQSSADCWHSRGIMAPATPIRATTGRPITVRAITCHAITARSSMAATHMRAGAMPATGPTGISTTRSSPSTDRDGRASPPTIDFRSSWRATSRFSCTRRLSGLRLSPELRLLSGGRQSFRNDGNKGGSGNDFRVVGVTQGLPVNVSSA